MMILYVDMVNDAIIGLANEPARHRIVVIQLTPEQEKLIQPELCGQSGSTQYFEQAIPISIQESYGGGIA